MAFTVNDLNDLIRILREQPEWLREVRRVVLTDELLALPDLVRELAEAQRRTDERLAEFQRRTDERFAELAEAQRRTDEQVAEMRGTLLEVDYRAKVGAIFGGRLRKPKAVDPGDLWDLLRGRLDELEIRQVVTSDLIVRGQLLPPQAQGESDLWMTVEVSSVIDRNDVARAADRAELLRKAGLPAIPVAAGKRLTQGASLLAAQLRVVLVKNGNPIGWDNALESTLHWRPPAA